MIGCEKKYSATTAQKLKYKCTMNAIALPEDIK